MVHAAFNITRYLHAKKEVICAVTIIKFEYNTRQKWVNNCIVVTGVNEYTKKKRMKERKVCVTFTHN